MNTDDLKHLASRADAEARSREAAAAFPDLAAADGVLDVSVAEMDTPIGNLMVAVTSRGLACVAFEGRRYRDELLGASPGRSPRGSCPPRRARTRGGASWMSTSPRSERRSTCMWTGG